MYTIYNIQIAKTCILYTFCRPVEKITILWYNTILQWKVIHREIVFNFYFAVDKKERLNAWKFLPMRTFICANARTSVLLCELSDNLILCIIVHKNNCVNCAKNWNNLMLYRFTLWHFSRLKWEGVKCVFIYSAGYMLRRIFEKFSENFEKK